MPSDNFIIIRSNNNIICFKLVLKKLMELEGFSKILENAQTKIKTIIR
jgi:hypothetical protein